MFLASQGYEKRVIDPLPYPWNNQRGARNDNQPEPPQPDSLNLPGNYIPLAKNSPSVKKKIFQKFGGVITVIPTALVLPGFLQPWGMEVSK